VMELRRGEAARAPLATTATAAAGA
jgi:hypothetical protein